MRFPSYHLDLNPIELIWATAISQQETSLNMEDVRKKAEEFSRISQEGWEQRCKHITNI